MVENEKQQLDNTLQVVDNLPVVKQEPKDLITDDAILGYYEVAMKNINDDRLMAGEKFDLIFDEIVNNGDATTSSKEMATNLLKMKFDASDRMIKILDLWTRIKLKERNTMPDALKAKTNIKNQQNNINIQTNGRTGTKDLIDMVDNIAENNG